MRNFRMLCAAAVLLCAVSVSHANVVINIVESGGNVVATGSGTINTSSLGTPNVDERPSTEMSPTKPGFFFAQQGIYLDWYGLGTMPGSGSFGTGATSTTTNTTGDLFGFENNGEGWNFYTPASYTSNANLSATAMWTNETFLSLGLTQGNYTWSWGSGVDADYITLNIGGSDPTVPEPSTYALFALGCGGLVLWKWKQRCA